jgi:protein-tyrosine-phosphatase
MSVLETFRGWRRLNYLLDKAYMVHHQKQRRLASAILKNKFENRTGNIIIVCKGNVCRSAFLAEYLKTIIYPADRFTFTSAGFRTSAGSTSPEEAIHSAKTTGIDLSAHRGTCLTKKEVEEADLVVGMEPIHHLEFLLRYFKWRRKFLLLRALESEPDSLIIKDPFDKGRKVFDDCFALLIRDGNVLVSALHEIVSKEKDDKSRSSL